MDLSAVAYVLGSVGKQTHQVNRMKTVASRFMLPIEMFLGMKLIVLACVGAFGQGTLNRALIALGDNVSWGILIGSVGLPVLVLAMVEWCAMRRASDDDILRVVTARAFLAFLGAVTWIAALGFIVVNGIAGVSMYAVMTCPLAAFFQAWSFVENMKVRYALDHRYQTSTLRFHR